MSLPPQHRKEIPKSSWVWDIASGELSLGLTFLQLFGKQARRVPDELKASVIKVFTSAEISEDILFFRRTKHTISGKDYYVEWVGEPIERCDEGNISKMAGFAELGSLRDDFTLSLNQEALFFSRLMDNLRESVYFKDLEGRFIKANKACAKKHGLNDPADLVGKSDFDLFEDEYAQLSHDDEQEIIRTKKPIFNKVEKEIFSDGQESVKWASTSKMPLYDDNGVLIGTYGITRDITAEMKAEERLKQGYEMLHNLSSHVPGFFYMYTYNKNGTAGFPYASDGIRSVYELEPEDVKHDMSAISDRIHPEDRQTVIDSLKHSSKTLEDWFCDYRVLLPKRGERWLRGQASVEEQPAGSIIGYGYIWDVTERRKIYNANMQLKSQFQAIFDSVPNLIFVKDFNGRFLMANQAACKFFGKAKEEIIGLKDEDLGVSSEMAVKYREDDLKVIRFGEVEFIPEMKSKNNSGQTVYHQTIKVPFVQQGSEKNASLAIVTDITYQKQIEKELSKRDVLFSKLSQQAPGFLYLHNVDKDGNVSFPFVSDGIVDVLELEKKELNNSIKPLMRRVHREDLIRVMKSIEHSVKTQEEWDCEYRVVLPNKGTRWVKGRAKPELQEDGSVLSSGYLSDITLIKEKEYELNETLDIVGDQNKRLLNFAHIVSHNLRNHAGNISMLISLFDMEESEEEKKELLKYLKTASERLNISIEDLNEIIDKQYKTQNDLKELKPAEMIEKVKQILVSDILSYNVKFEDSIDEELTIEYNPAYLESIMLNLLSNAIKYRDPDRKPAIHINLYKKEGHVYFEVADNGLGIDMEKHGDKLFGMYSTFHGNENSKGIGLFITKNQIESLGGSITVESELGKGTTFKIKLT